MNNFSDYLLRHPLPQQSQHQPLTEAECDELFELFDDDSLPDTTMSPEMADGYMTACVIGPVPVPAHEWMQAIFGQPALPVCADAEKQHRLLQLLLHRHRDITVATAMAPGNARRENFFVPLIAPVDEKDCITPYQLDEDGKRLGEWNYKKWTDGFHRAVMIHPQWGILLEKFGAFSPLAPIVLFGEGYNPEKPELQIEEHEELVGLLCLSIYSLREFWQDWKQTPPPFFAPIQQGRAQRPLPVRQRQKIQKMLRRLKG